LSRYQVSRCLAGITKPSLPVFFALVDALSGRLPELVAHWVDIERIPALVARHRATEAARQCAYTQPWSSAVLALIDAGKNSVERRTPSGKALARFEPADTLCRELGSLLDISPETAANALVALAAAGIIRSRRGQLHIEAPLLTDTRQDPEAARRLRRHWASVSANRLAAPQPNDLFAHNVFAVSRQGYDTLRDMQTRFYQSARAVIKESEPSEVAALMVLHLMAW
jgi:hypothetical protein